MTPNTILVIEDNIKNLKLVKALLKMEEYTVLETDTAESGLDLARKHQPDLILMDIQLPGMDGLEATRIAKADDSIKHIPIVAITSYAMEGDRGKSIEAGCDGYITKPIDTRSFLGEISEYIGSKKQITKEQHVKVSKSQGAKILVVDDDLKNLKLLKGILASGGDYVVFTAESGENAIKIVEEKRPDLMLLDIMMPGMDGYEVTRHIKANPELEKIPIILVTALDGEDDKIRGMEAGAEEFLTKPVNPVEIETRVESMLKLKRYRDQLDIRSQSRNQLQGNESISAVVSTERSLSRILVVEDNEKDLKILLTHLVDLYEHVDVVRTGSEAVKKLSEGVYDLALLDILLPEMDGFQICEYVKTDETIKNTQVLLISCLDDLENKIRAVELGADDYLIKPYDPRELQTRITALLKKKSYIDGLHSLYEKALNSALLDGLTGLYNHIYLKRFLELEIKRSKRQGHTTALLMIDLDDFKKINDTCGHAAGDDILKCFGQLLKETIREIDVAARYGGEEFVVVMPYGDQKSIIEIGNRVCKSTSILQIPDRWKESISGITVSVGGAIFPAHADSAEDLIEAADYMLYKAKRSGKNRVLIKGIHT